MQELEKKIKALFSTFDDPDVSVREDGEYIHIIVSNMYEPPRFKTPLSFIEGMMEIAKLCGKTELTIDYEISHSGCETCDYGSEYGYEFKAWNREDV